MLIKKAHARRNAKEINVRKVNGARPIARKLVVTAKNGRVNSLFTGGRGQ